MEIDRSILIGLFLANVFTGYRIIGGRIVPEPGFGQGKLFQNKFGFVDMLKLRA
jgi:hypothetical protein